MFQEETSVHFFQIIWGSQQTQDARPSFLILSLPCFWHEVCLPSSDPKYQGLTLPCNMLRDQKVCDNDLSQDCEMLSGWIFPPTSTCEY